MSKIIEILKARIETLDTEFMYEKSNIHNTAEYSFRLALFDTRIDEIENIIRIIENTEETNKREIDKLWAELDKKKPNRDPNFKVEVSIDDELCMEYFDTIEDAKDYIKRIDNNGFKIELYSFVKGLEYWEWSWKLIEEEKKGGE